MVVIGGNCSNMLCVQAAKHSAVGGYFVCKRCNVVLPHTGGCVVFFSIHTWCNKNSNKGRSAGQCV